MRQQAAVIELEVVALVCDLDGVIRHYDAVAQAAVESRYGLPKGAIAKACFSSALLQEAITGRVPDAIWREAAARNLPSLSNEVASQAVKQWSVLPATLAADVLDLLAKVRARCPVVLLTNATDRLAADSERLGLLTLFDAIVNSSEVGAPKPEPAAFEAATTAVCRLLGQPVEPSTIAFVDDTEGHVKAAQALGWLGHAFIDATHLQAFLAACRLLR